MRFIFVSFKKNILPLIFILFAFCLVIFSKSNLVAAKSGLSLWVNNVIPALFPFFVITELLSHTNIIYYFGKLFRNIMRPVFNVPGEASFPFIMGLISGYPVGGKIVADMRSNGICTKDEGERMLAFTNNSGPLFILSSVGISLFGDTKTGILLFVTHILSCITVGILLARLSTAKTNISSSFSTGSVNKSVKKDITFKDLGGMLGKSIQNATSTILTIGGFIVIFSVIISILDNSNILSYLSTLLSPILKLLGFDLSFSVPILAGLTELTNGVNRVSQVVIKSLSQNVILCAFLLGFGGFSVLLQVFSIVSHTDLSMRKYVLGKFLQGIFAAIYTFLAFKIFPFLSLDIAPTFSTLSSTLTYPVSFFGINNYLLILITIVLIVFLSFSKTEKKSCQRKKC